MAFVGKLSLRSEYKTLEFKYLVAQEKIEQLQKDRGKLTEQATEVSNAAVQTNSLSLNEKSCQTNSLTRKVFKVKQ